MNILSGIWKANDSRICQAINLRAFDSVTVSLARQEREPIDHGSISLSEKLCALDFEVEQVRLFRMHFKWVLEDLF